LTSVLLIHHAANGRHDWPPNSLAALRACLEAQARLVEVDIVPLTGGDFALLHDRQLGNTTDGVGNVCAMTADQVCRLHYKRNDAVTAEPVGLLSQAVSLIRHHSLLQELQLDLKTHAPLTEAVLKDLLRIVAPVKARVRVTSVADWALRRLYALDRDLPLGFDPLLYLDVAGEVHDEAPTPFRVGAYGYSDDHPLASQRWGSPADYLSARAEALWVQSPQVGAWYIRASLLAQTHKDGFDWIAYLHAHGVQVDAWTLDTDRPGHTQLAHHLVALGIDRITTNNATRLAAALGQGAEF